MVWDLGRSYKSFYFMNKIDKKIILENIRFYSNVNDIYIFADNIFEEVFV